MDDRLVPAAPPEGRDDPFAAAVTLARHRSGDAQVRMLSDRGGALLVASGGVVVKLHAPGTDRDDLAVRVRLAATDPSGVLVAPVEDLVHESGGRLLTVWPLARVIGVADLDDAPWPAVGALAARLHLCQAPQDVPQLPRTRAGRRVGEAITRLAATPADRRFGQSRDAVLRAAACLPAWTRGGDASGPGAQALVHGDLHLGQLARLEADPQGWRLLDVDDLGVGAAAWDLARPAAWYAAGVLDPRDWAAFLDGYRSLGGPAVPRDGDPWPFLDDVARALVVQTAARVLIEANTEGREPDAVGDSFLAASARIAAVGGAGADPPLT